MLSRRTTLGLLISVGGLATVTSCATRRSAERAETAYPPLGRRVATPDGAIHLLEKGPRDAPAVVLIHGASGNLRDFSFSFMDRLADRYRVIAVDRPGFGHSDLGPSDRHRPSVQARMIRDALKSLEVDRSILVGHSWGGAAVTAWALDAPETVSGVVILAGATQPWEGSAGLGYSLGATPIIGDILAAGMRTFISDEGAQGFVNRVFAPQQAPEGYLPYVGIGLSLRHDTIRANATDIAELKDALIAQAPRYGTLSMPVEVLHGTEDEIVSVGVHSEPTANAIPGATLTLLDGIGHMPHHSAAAECVAAIDRVHQRATV
ncbi:MAG: alpha/beta hydrolase [Pseudomonadota bacterium]